MVRQLDGSGRFPGAADPFDLDRFIVAQSGTYAAALAEIRAGEKRSHWMWFVFPQIDGLGTSPVSRRFAIQGRDEAEAYLEHRILGDRLSECFEALMAIEGRSAHDIFGSPDDLKLRSCATLFASIAGPESIFNRVLVKFFRGEPDLKTLRLLNPAS